MGRRQRRRLRGGKLAPEVRRPAHPFFAPTSEPDAAPPDEPPPAATYPWFVGDDPENQHRYDLALAVASRAMNEPPETYSSRFAASRLFLSEVET